MINNGLWDAFNNSSNRVLQIYGKLKLFRHSNARSKKTKKTKNNRHIHAYYFSFVFCVTIDLKELS